MSPARIIALALGAFLVMPARVLGYLAADLRAGPVDGILPFTWQEHRHQVRRALAARSDIHAIDIHQAARAIPNGGKVSLLVAFEEMVADGELAKYYSPTAKAYKYTRAGP